MEADGMGMFTGRRGFLGGLVLGVALTGSGLVVASIPNSAGEITACVTTRSGAVRIIDAEAGQVCRRGEQVLAWDEGGSTGGSGSFRLLDSTGSELGIIVGDGAGNNECWVVWDGAAFRSYNLFGEPCQNVLTGPLGEFLYATEDCTGVAYTVLPISPGPRGPYGIEYPIIEQYNGGDVTFRPVVSLSPVTADYVEALSVDVGDGCSEIPPQEVTFGDIVNFGDPLEASGPLTVVFE